MRAAVCVVLALCLAQAASAKQKQVVFSPPPPPGSTNYNSPGLDFSFILPGQSTATFTQASFNQLCNLIDDATPGALICLSGAWANVTSLEGVTALKVFGQAYFTFATTPNTTQLTAAGVQRDALLVALAANTTSILGSAFPAAIVNCDASISSAASVTATGGALYYTGATGSLGWAGVTAASPAWSGAGAIAPTPLAGALAQLYDVAIAGVTGANSPVGIDVGKTCSGGLVYTGTWAPACDQPNSPGFSTGVVYITGPAGGTGPRTSWVAATGSGNGNQLCPQCYSPNGNSAPWSYNGPNKGKYCTKRTGVLGAVAGTPYASDAEAFDQAASCVSVGVWTQYSGSTGGYVATGVYNGATGAYVATGGQGTLCVGQAEALFSGVSPTDTATQLTGVIPAGTGPSLTSTAACQALGVSSLTNTPCTNVKVTTGAVAAVLSPGVLGLPYSGVATGGVGTCNTVSSFTSTVGRTGASAGLASNNGVNSCLLLAEAFSVVPAAAPPPPPAAVPPTPVPAPVPSPAPKPSPVPSPSPAPVPSPAPKPSPVPSPSPKPSPSPAPACELSGVYQIVAKGRSSCRAKEYLVYSSSCGSTAGAFLRKAGSFSTKNSYWTFNTRNNDAYQSSMIATSRNKCSGKNGLTGSGSTKSNQSVFFAGTSHTWQLGAISDDCTTVNLIDLKRQEEKYPAYLSTSGNCSNTTASLTSKDQGTGRQQFILVKVRA